MDRIKIETITCWALLALIFVLSLTLRIAVPWDQVFTAQWIKFTDNDAYFYMRLLDNLSGHFPQLGGFDLFYPFPGGIDLGGQRLFFVYFMGFFTWLFGGAAPSQHIVDLVGVYFPAVLGALLVFPVFFIGRAIFNKWAGIVASLFITLIPGEFLARTLLGNADIHVFELFFSTTFLLFAILAAQSCAGIQLHPFTSGVRRSLVRPLAFSLVAGLFLGMYLLSWQGALFFVFISFLWLVIQFIIDHLRGRSSGALGLAGAAWFFIALLLSLTIKGGTLTWLALAVAIAASLLLPLISWYLKRRALKPWLFPLAVAVLAGIGALGIYILNIINPRFVFGVNTLVTSFFNWNQASTIAETQPLLFDRGAFTLAPLWGNYTIGSIMALAGLAALVRLVIREGRSGHTLLLVWSILALLAALGLRRFAYYFAVDVALLSGYTGWLILKACGLNQSETTEIAAPAVARQPGKKKGGASLKGRRDPGAKPALLALGIAAVALLTVYPNTGPLPGGDRPVFDVATRALYTPSDAWYETLDWMRKNTPEPFGDPQYYYRYYGQGPAGSSSAGNAPAYTVFCWWDYGYWVTRIGHRVPFSNPGTAQRGEQSFFLAADGQQAAEIASSSNMKYVLVNDYLVNWTSGFPTVAGDALQSTSKYYEIYYRQQAGSLSPTLVYYPEYYQTMAVRLYCFDGKQYAPGETAVMSWEARTGADGRPYKEITALKITNSYNDAVHFVAAQTSGNWRIVGKDPNVSPVPLEELKDYRLAYGSSQKVKTGTAETSEVKLFEYAGTPK
jgi:oligosaccharyl transferase (archaeosortase A-associated)